MSATDAIASVTKLQRDYNDLKTFYDRHADTDKGRLVEENTRLREFVDSVAFLTTCYDTPVLGPQCHNHVDLIKHLNESLAKVDAK